MHKAYQEGALAWEQNKKHKDCPYKQGTPEHQQWVNGFGDRGDKAFVEFWGKLEKEQKAHSFPLT